MGSLASLPTTAISVGRMKMSLRTVDGVGVKVHAAEPRDEDVLNAGDALHAA